MRGQGQGRAIVSRLLQVVALLAPASSLLGMDPGPPLSRYLRERWDAEQGFPGGAVHALAQAADGYLWIGTENGLVRFDGREFEVVSRGGPSSVDQVLGLAADGDGSLWARLPAPFMLRHRRGRLETFLSGLDPPESAITAMSPGRDGSVIVSTLMNGALRLRGDAFERLAGQGAMPGGLVIAMTETSDGTIWLGTRDAGLFTLAGGKTRALLDGLPDRKVNCLLALSDRDVWVGTDSGVVRWDGTQLTRRGVPAALARVQALALVRDREANLWVGSNAGLIRVDSQGASFPDDRDQHSKEPVTALLDDREGNLWVGSARGIERWRERRFTTYTPREGLSSESNGPVHVDALGRTWFAPAEGGLYRLEAGRAVRVAGSGVGADVVYSIAPGKDGLWLGRQRGGLTRLRFEGDAFTSTTFTRSEGLAQDSVFAVHEDREGAVWAGTLSGGLSRLREGRFSSYSVVDGLPSNSITSILDTRDGRIWAGTPSGLGAFSQGRWTSVGTDEGLPSADVNSLLEGSDGVLWVATAGGLAFARTGEPRAVFEALQTLREPIFGLAEGAGGWLWLAAAGRVLRVRGESMLGGPLREGDLVAYDAADGLRGAFGVKRHRSVVADGQGRIWFSMNRGLSVAASAPALHDAAPAVAHVEGLAADGRALALADTVRVPPGPRQVSFRYAGVSLARPERVRFRYRLDGVDSDWSAPVAAREAVYANLDAGTYTFSVLASSSDGLWNGEPAVVRLEIAPVFWSTGWFRLSALVAASLGGWALYRLRLRQWTRRLNERFEERLAERMRLAHELHDTLLQGVVSASMQLHVVADQLSTESPVRPLLSRVQELMRQVIEEGRNTVRGLRSVEPDEGDLAAAFSRLPDQIAADHPVGLRVLVEGVARPLRPAVHDEVYRIGREALLNAFHHARARSIEVELEYGSHDLRLLVRDDGRGIDPQVLQSGREGHFGLSGMRERAQRIGGRLKVWSAAYAGTEVELSLRNSLAFARAPDDGALARLRRRWLPGRQGQTGKDGGPTP